MLSTRTGSAGSADRLPRTIKISQWECGYSAKASINPISSDNLRYDGPGLRAIQGSLGSSNAIISQAFERNIAGGGTTLVPMSPSKGSGRSIGTSQSRHL